LSTLLEMEDVTSYYGKTPILKGVNLSVKEGSCLCVLGRNGVGKTTLMRTMVGLVDKMTGRISLDGVNVGAERTDERVKHGIGFVPQGRQILGKFTVRENILLGTFARKDAKTEIPEICLEMFPYLRENLDRRAGLLSGGQQQQLAIARALAVNPQILLLDEPTEGIQPNIVAEIGEKLKHLNKSLGITLILTEQHIRVARALGDFFIMMDNGRVVESGAIDGLTDSVVQRHMTV
jgi:urea transport system ATP-binding protein